MISKEKAGVVFIPILTYGILSFPKLIDSFISWDRGVIIQISLLLISLFYALVYSGRVEMGLTFNFTRKNRKHLISAAVLGFASLISMILVSQLAPNLKQGGHPGMSSSPLAIIFKIYLLASIAEEFYNRGFIMHWFKNWNHIKIGFITVPNLIAALLFAFAHLGLLNFMDYRLVMVIVVSAFCLGLTAGLAREDSGSLYPAYLVHLIFNLIGSGVPMLLMKIAH